MSSNECRQDGSGSVTARHFILATTNDEELRQLVSPAVMAFAEAEAAGQGPVAARAASVAAGGLGSRAGSLAQTSSVFTSAAAAHATATAAQHAALVASGGFALGGGGEAAMLSPRSTADGGLGGGGSQGGRPGGIPHRGKDEPVASSFKSKGGGVTVVVGQKVQRGPDWQAGSQDGGVGGVGTVMDVRDGRAVVRWRRVGGSYSYRNGHGGAFDLAPATGKHFSKAVTAAEATVAEATSTLNLEVKGLQADGDEEDDEEDEEEEGDEAAAAAAAAVVDSHVELQQFERRRRRSATTG